VCRNLLCVALPVHVVSWLICGMGAGLAFGRLDATSTASQQFVEIVNPTPLAVDVSGWKLQGTSSSPLRPGAITLLK
jgi:hypothetical protein